MLDLIKLIQNPENVTDEQVLTAYKYLKEYCDEKNLDIMETLNDDKNIPIAVKEIHSQLPLKKRLFLRESMITNIITTNIDFIRQKAKEQIEAEKKS